MESNRTLIDRLQQESASSLERLRRAGGASASPQIGARPTFARGDRAIDLMTGLPGVVNEARRDDTTGALVLRVQLVDQRVVFRTIDELAPDQAVAVKPGV